MKIELTRGRLMLIDEEDYYELIYPMTVHVDGMGYAFVSPSKGRTKQVSRLVLHLEKGDPRQADHINRNRLDNRKCNLRILTHSQNSQNRSPNEFYGNNRTKSKYRGVWPEFGGWRARVTIKGVSYNLGTFDTEEKAAFAASEFRKKKLPYSTE